MLASMFQKVELIDLKFFFTFTGTYVLYFAGTCVLIIIPGTQVPNEMTKIIVHETISQLRLPVNSIMTILVNGL